MHDEVLARLSDRLESMEVGDSLDGASDSGTVVNETPIGSIWEGVPGGRALRVELGGLPPSSGPLAEE